MAAIVRYGNRNVLRIIASGIKQANADLAERPTQEEGTPGKFFISFRYKVITAGTLTIGFPGQNLYFTERLEQGEEYIRKEYSGTWDGTGDFELKFTGEMYLHSLALTANAYEDLMTIFNTKIEQTNKKITLLSESMSESMNTLASEIQVTAEGIDATNKRIDAVDGSLREIGLSIDGIEDNLSLYVKKDGLGSAIDVALDNISVSSRNIYFTGNISANGNVSIRSDGTIKAIGGEFSGELKGATGEFNGKVSTKKNGTRIELDPDTNSIRMYNESNQMVGTFDFISESWNGATNYYPRVRLMNYHNSTLVSELRLGTSNLNIFIGSDSISLTRSGLMFYINGKTKTYSST